MSNGLICLPGREHVEDVRAFHGAVDSLSLVTLSANDVGAVVAPAHDRQAQARIGHFGAARGVEQLLGGAGRGQQRESGRAPGALAEAGQRAGFDPPHEAADGGAGVGIATLRRREVRADQPLDRRDAARERLEVSLDQRRHHAHQQLMADACGVLAREGRQRVDGALLVGAVQAGRARVLHQQHAPFIRKFGAEQQRRRVAFACRPAIDEEPAAVEARAADARPGTAAQQLDQFRGGQGQRKRGGEGAADRHGELRSRTEAGMGRQRLVQLDVQRLVAAGGAAQRIAMRREPPGIVTRCGDMVGWRRSQA